LTRSLSVDASERQKKRESWWSSCPKIAPTRRRQRPLTSSSREIRPLGFSIRSLSVWYLESACPLQLARTRKSMLHRFRHHAGNSANIACLVCLVLGTSREISRTLSFACINLGRSNHPSLHRTTSAVVHRPESLPSTFRRFGASCTRLDSRARRDGMRPSQTRSPHARGRPKSLGLSYCSSRALHPTYCPNLL
jgi:hypothetical protein